MLDLMSSFQVHFLLMIFAGWVNRSQQGVIELIEKPSGRPNVDGAVDRRERLGGILNYYYRRAA
jgi:hypothetical protein